MSAYKKTSTVEDEAPTTELYLEKVMNVSCFKHNAIQGVPCFHIPKQSGFGYHAGICNKRAIIAGFNAPIDPRSLTQRSFRRNDGERN